MRMRLALVVLVASTAALAADQIVGEQPSATEVDRYLVVRDGDTTLKLDSRTGASWTLCPVKKKSSWCRVKDRSPYPAGPVGRYRIVPAVQPLMMLDTVSGRGWVRCDDPTPDKSFSWCPVEE